MSRAPLVLVVATAVALAGCGPGPRFGSLAFGPRKFTFAPELDVFTLDNGLVVALLPDRRTNLVGVDVRYAVGSIEDPYDRAGMAHLVEHLTFSMRASADGPSIAARLHDAALFHNAYTSFDETHYMELALADRLPELLSLEARRMSLDCDALDEAVFLRERDVVLEERAQGIDARAELASDRAAMTAPEVWGKGHPYTRDIGSDEVAAAKRSEACAFLTAHYAPDRALLVVTGNFDPTTARADIERELGVVTRRGTGTPRKVVQPALTGTRSDHEIPGDRSRVVLSFSAPVGDSEDDAVVRSAAGYLERGVGGRAEVSIAGGRGARIVQVSVELADGEKVDTVVDAVFSRAKSTARGALGGFEVHRSERRNAIIARLDSFWARGRALADHIVSGDAGPAMTGPLAAIDTLQQADVRTWIADHVVRARSHVAVYRATGVDRVGDARVAATEEVHRLGVDTVDTDPADADRVVDLPADATARRVDDYELPNGLRVVLAPIEGAMMVDASLTFPVGRGASDRKRARVASITPWMLTDDLSPDFRTHHLERLDWVFGLGTEVRGLASEDSTTFHASGMALFADWHVWRLFWRLDAGEVMDPDVGRSDDPEVQKEVRRLEKSRWIRHERAVTEAAFGSGLFWFDDEQAPEVSRGDLESFRKASYRPRGATLIIAGGFDPAVMRRHVQELFGSWRDGAAETPDRSEPREHTVTRAWRVIASEKESQVSVTVAFAAVASRGGAAARAVLLELLDERLRAAREGLGATYGAHAFHQRHLGMTALRIEAALDPQRAGAALAQILTDLATLRDDPRAFAASFVRARRRALARALADNGTSSARIRSLERLVADGDDVTALDAHARRIAAVTIDDLAALATAELAANRQIVVVSGRRDAALDAIVAAGADRAAVAIDE